MKIKDIRQFRTLYKNEIREIDSANRNEHFVGVRTENDGKSQFGFFEIYHGDKEGFNESDGIRGFLEGFLDMAKDGQAVYEFMQNAVDAKSSKFCLFWGKDEVDGNTYLLVVNNGKMFNMDSVRSILNVGVSTKSSNNFTIGKFGIGFKLAHRLVGRENGLDELIHQNYGPILFSWQNNEINQLENLIDSPVVIPEKQQYEVYSEKGKRRAIVKTDDPWLFKILITNFPCQPENKVSDEIIFDNQYKQTSNAFSKLELQALGRWTKSHATYLENDFKEGSLFFIRLGQGKQSHLEEENLEEGVKFSLAILNKIAKQSLNHEGLKTVNLRGKELEPVDLLFQSFVINKVDNKDQYRYLRFGKTEDLTEIELSKEEADSDIEILLGFTEYKKAKEAFHNAPNFYLFFPLSEEKHKLRFILHSNAFYKSASRTFLQKGSVGEEGINERLFTVFIEKLVERMLLWANDSDKKEKNKFIELYANLLLSDSSDNPERVWINEPLYEPILEFIQKNIPIKDFANNSFQLAVSSHNVLIKNTALPVDSEQWLLGTTNWFYWNKEDDESIYNEAISTLKLGIQTFSILQLLQQKDIYHKINKWLDNNDDRINLLVKELNLQLSDSGENEKTELDNLKDNISNLNLWKFDNGNYYAISEISDPEFHSTHLLTFGKIEELVPFLKQAGYFTSIISLSAYPHISTYIRVKQLIKYFHNYSYLTSLFNHGFSKTSFLLAEKNQILKLFVKLGDDRSTEDRIERIKQLALFSNQQNKVVPFKQLLNNTSFNWLQPYVIKQSENSDSLKEYLVMDEADIYSDIIIPFWDGIVSNKNLTSNDIISAYQKTQTLYIKTPKAPTLSDQKIIKINSIFHLENDAFYYSNTLLDFTEKEFEDLKSIAVKLNLNPLPDYELLPFYNKPPFKISETPIIYSFTNPDININEREAKAFLKLCAKEDTEFFKKTVIYQNTESEIVISEKTENVHPVLSNNPKVNDYIAKYHSTSLRILPNNLSEYGANIALQGDKLINHLSHDCDFEDDTQSSELIELVIASSLEAKNKLADTFGPLLFDLETNITIENASVRFVQLLLSLNDNSKAAEIIKGTVTVVSGEDTIELSNTNLLGQNEIIFEEGEKKFTLLLSSILPNPNSNATKIIGQLTEILAPIITVDKQILDAVFGLTGQTEKDFIYNSLQAEYNTLPLVNAQQLAFLLHYSNSKSNIGKLDGFKAATVQGISNLNGVHIYCTNNEMPFIHPTLVLNNQYEGLKELIVNEQPYFKASNNTNIYYNPYFENNKFIIPEITSITDPSNNLCLLNLIFNNWKQDKERLKIIELEDKKKWIDLIGFEPNCTIVGSNLALKTEELPDFMDAWLDKAEQDLNSNERYVFLRSLGVSLPGSDIVKIRKFLVGEEAIMPGINYNLPEILVSNTMVLLSNRSCQFTMGSPQTELLKELLHRLPDDLDLKTIPLPVIDSNKNRAIILSIVTEAEYIDNQVINQLDDLNYEVNLLPVHIGKTIIYASLFRTINNLDKFFSPIKIDFDILDSESVASTGIEWNRDFYNQWKLRYPIYKINYYPGNIPYLLQYDSTTFFRYSKNEIICNGHEIIVNNEKNDKSIIALIEVKNYLPSNVLLDLKELFNKYDDSIQDFLYRIQSNKKLREEFERLQQKEKIEQKKKELTDGFGNSMSYTMSWFMNLLELMVLSGGGKDLANPQGNIVFNQIKYDPLDLRLITFSNPSKTLSPSIDLFTDFKATFHYIDENEIKRNKQIKISGLSKKGHEVIAIPTNSSDLDSINLSGVKEVELTFVRVLDLISKLTTAFKSLDLEDDFNLKSELTENINFIFGPPGTGKTTEIAKQVINKIETGISKNILILTPTNKAADVIVKRILDLVDAELDPDGWLCRYGASTDLDLINRGMVYDGNTFKLHLFQKCVMVTTIQRFPYEKVITNIYENGEEKTSINEIAWDTIIFDEASMIMLPAIIYPLYKRKFKRYDQEELTEFIIGGDPLQIPPIYDIADSDLGEDNEDVKEENIYTMIGLKSFDETVQADIPKYGTKIKNLPIQYRSIEAIGTLFSKFQYNGVLGHGRNLNLGGSPYPRQLPDYFVNLGFKPITIIRYPVNSSDALFNPQKLNGSPLHLYSSFLINELILKFREETTEDWDIGVVAAYRSQATLLNKLIESHSDKSKLNIVTDTVHGFQGGECDLVFNVFNPSSTRSQFSYFLKKEFIINVAISRARDYLIILVPDEDTEGLSSLNLIHEKHPNSLLSIIKELPDNSVSYIDASELEKKIMGKKDFFQKNSFTNIHQTVNIYSDLYKDYIVRVSGNALDIHIKKQ
jgi:hypothetical protein